MNQFNMPGVLSDRQIRELCVTPDLMLSIEDTSSGGIVRFEKTTINPITENTLKRGQRLRRARPLTDEEKAAFQPMISPFIDGQVRSRKVVSRHATDGIENDEYREEKIVSFGLTSFGYDVRCADEFKVFSNLNSTVIDPKNFDPKNLVDFKGDVCIIPPNSFVLARTVERFNIPRNVVANCVGKSTYARCGISVMVTPLEPEWEGYLTLEFANTTPLPAKLYANEGCAQIQFFRGSEDCETSYKDRGGKYMGQVASPVTPKM